MDKVRAEDREQEVCVHMQEGISREVRAKIRHMWDTPEGKEELRSQAQYGAEEELRGSTEYFSVESDRPRLDDASSIDDESRVRKWEASLAC